MEQLDPELRHEVAEAPVARLATVRPDGRPHVVPITFALDGDVIVTAVDHKPKTTTSLQRLRNIDAHPVASVVVDHYEDDWSRLWWVRGDGTARIVTEGPERERAVERLVDKYSPYRQNPPLGPVIRVDVDRWASWSAGGALPPPSAP
ncbi:MAG TPA: TIGR03668 family PPOX class F420-dependent oxidoreductase [Acidimicrobiales bacterium]|nr:TIGR03668 family PPOX class F420-dependent oxidoreductase [Acidimicrobiales bacterium]